MGYSNVTPNYKLPQYIASDRPSYLGDWNEAMGIIDSGMEENKEGLTATNTTVANMKVYVDNKVTESKDYVDNQITAMNVKVNNTYTKAEADSKFVPIFNGGLCVVAGDSITLGTGTSNPSTDAWPVKLAAKRNLNVKNYAQNNAGFVAAGTGTPSRNFIQQLQAAAADATFSNDDVKLVIVAGGINDVSQVSSLESNAVACLNYAKNTFTNAQVWCVPVIAGKAPLPTLNGGNRWECVPPIINACDATGVNKIVGGWCWMIGQSQFASDDIHPNTAGAAKIADYINSGLNHNNTFPSYKGEATAQNGTSVGNVVVTSTNGVVSISGNFNLSQDVAQYKPVFLLPEWCTVAAATMISFYNNNKIIFGYIPAGKHQLDVFGVTYADNDPYCYLQATSFNMGLQ